MTYNFIMNADGSHVMHPETRECAGWIRPLKGGGFSVHRHMAVGNQREKIATVKSADEAVSVLAAYYSENPPVWIGGKNASRYTKWTLYGYLTVERQGTKRWIAMRYRNALLHEGDDAIFTTAEEAKSMADQHLRDGFPNVAPANDGFSWYNPRPHSAVRVAA
jgi:hypothetical protein